MHLRLVKPEEPARKPRKRNLKSRPDCLLMLDGMPRVLLEHFGASPAIDRLRAALRVDDREAGAVELAQLLDAMEQVRGELSDIAYVLRRGVRWLKSDERTVANYDELHRRMLRFG